MQSLRLLSFALVAGTAYTLPQTPPAASPAWAPPADLPASTSTECKHILQDAGVRAPDNVIIPNNYIVDLKPFAKVQDVLSLPALKGVTPKITYKKQAQPGFAAQLTYDQVCSIYHDAAVDHVEVDIKAPKATKPASQVFSEHDSDAFGNWPVGQAGVAGAPDLTGLDADCAKIIWYTVLSVDPAKIVKGDYLVQFKSFTKAADVEKMLQNPKLKDAKITPSDPASGKKDYDDSYDEKFVQGKISSQGLCFLLHQAQTAFVTPTITGPPASGPKSPA